VLGFEIAGVEEDVEFHGRMVIAGGVQSQGEIFEN
jgi:hypothetical protein